MNFLNLVIIGAVLIGASKAASVASAVSGDNCTIADTYQSISCSFRMMDFGEKIQELDVEDKSEMKEFKRSCAALENCFTSLSHCKPFNDPATKKAFEMVKTYCGTVTFLVENFKECDDKLQARNSTCYNDWDPFVEDVKLAEKKEKDEACKNFFGKDQCLQKEVVELCGQKQWEGLRDTLVSLNNDIVKQCDFKNVA
uniref:DUF19 domain-containing protein n=1 Tax=Caenorhabditis tropicalis TaxID=1561998 RepID=A0A1I7V2A0_9PELO